MCNVCVFVYRHSHSITDPACALWKSVSVILSLNRTHVSLCECDNVSNRGVISWFLCNIFFQFSDLIGQAIF